MLRASLERGSQALRLLTRGLLASLPSLRLDATAGYQNKFQTLYPVHSSGMVITGLVQRPYLLQAGFGIYNWPAPESSDYAAWLAHDNGALNSRLQLLTNGDDYNPTVSAALAAYENTLVPSKLIALPTLLRASAPGLVLTGIANDPYLTNQPYWAAVFIYNPQAGLAGGNRYDCYFANVCVCSSNTLLLRNLPLLGSVRYTLNALAPATVSVDSQSRASIDLADLMFPVRVKLELFTGIGATGRRWAQQTVLAYGGDVYRGRFPDPPPAAVASPPLSRVGWALTGSATVFGTTGELLDSDLYSGWSPGAPVGQWLKVDTLAPRLIGSCKMNVHSSYPNAFPRTGNIETSTDNVTFTVAGSWVQANISGGSVTITWPPVNARYVRVVPTSVCITSGDAWLFSEINLYATFP